ASVDALSTGNSISTNCEPPSRAAAKRTIFIKPLRNGAPLGTRVAIGARVRCSDRLCHREGRKVEMKLGVALPFIDVAVGGDPAAIREFAQTAEEIGIRIWPRPTTSSASMSRAAPIGATATRR